MEISIEKDSQEIGLETVISSDDFVTDQENTLDGVIEAARQSLLARQAEDGHWFFELEADTTIPSEYIILNHFLGEIDNHIERKLANYIRAKQGEHSGWPLYIGGDLDISASVKAYLALKLVGDDVASDHMQRARQAILAGGGGARCNVFTRITLALFGLIPWRAAPVTRAEILFAPKWFPLHPNKVSYWTRTVTIPLLVLTALKPKAKNPRNVNIDELFRKPPDKENYKLANPTDHWMGNVMLGLDRVAKYCEPLIPPPLTRKAIAKAMAFVRQRLNGEHGLGGIFPAMANTLMAFHALGYAADHPDVITARKALDKLLVVDGDSAYCQPCVSPIWDTGLAAHALLEAGPNGASEAMRKACDWLTDRQVLDVAGDWISKRPGIRPGGWAFQYRNDYYPDVDDTAVVIMALHRTRDRAYDEAIKSGTEWVLGMQSNNGGWAAFDVDNEYRILEHMPFADHGALLDPPTADVTARCVGMLAQLGLRQDHAQMSRAIAFLKRKQEADGSWYGRWGANYIYGTWSVLCALNAAGEDMQAPHIRRAVDWLKARQLPNGGWGEDCASYWDQRRNEVKAATPSQTAWAVLALIAAGEVNSEAVARGVKHLSDAFVENGGWRDEYFNAAGFPRVFFLRYHGYANYFPLWALARYRNLRGPDDARPEHGM